jgi:hypothetical protein
MVEQVGRLPAVEGVTGGATLGRDLASMRVSVTRKTALLQPEEGAREILLVVEEEIWPADELGAVASPADNPAVGSLQRVAGLSVVERLLTLLSPPDELKLPPVMLDMTALAGRVVVPGVETASGSDSSCQKSMAAQAEGGVHSLARLMALEALSGSVQLGVRFAQLSG